MKVAILTANTQVYKEQEEDKGGKVIRKIVEEAGQHVIFAKALPVDKKVLSTVMQRMADGHMADGLPQLSAPARGHHSRGAFRAGVLPHHLEEIPLRRADDRVYSALLQLGRHLCHHLGLFNPQRRGQQYHRRRIRRGTDRLPL